MIVVFEISPWVTARNREPERRLTTHTRRVETLFDEQRGQFQNKIKTKRIGLDLPAACRLAGRVWYLWTAGGRTREPRRKVDVVVWINDPIAGPGRIAGIRR